MSDIIKDLSKEYQKDGGISALEYKKSFEKKFSKEIKDFPQENLDGKPDDAEVQAIDDFLKSKVDVGILSQQDYDHMFAPIIRDLQTLTKEWEREQGEAGKSLVTLKEEANANKSVLDIWRKKDRASLVPGTPELAKIKDINTALVVMATLQHTTSNFDKQAFVNAYKTATGGKKLDANTEGGLQTLFQSKDYDSIINLIAIFPDPTQNEVFAIMRGDTFNGSADYKQNLADFDFSGSTGEFEKNYSSEGVIAKKKDQRKYASTVDMIGSMTGAQMGALLQDVESFYGGDTKKTQEKLVALYSSAHAKEGKLLFGEGPVTFDQIMGNPVAIAQLQSSLALLGYEKAYDYLTGAEKTVQHVKFGEKEKIVADDIENSDQMQESVENCYQLFITNAQKLIKGIQNDPDLPPAEKREKMQEVLDMMNNPAGLKAQFQNVLRNAMVNVADAQVRKQIALGAGVGKTAVLENLKFLQKQGFLHTVSGSMGMALAPLKGGAGLSLGVAVTRSGTKVNEDGASMFYSITPTLGTSALAGKGGLQFLPIQLNARLNVGKDFLLNKNANKKDFTLYQQNLVKSAAYAGAYGYVDFFGAGGGVYMRRDKDKGIDDKRQAMQEYFTKMLTNDALTRASSADEVYNEITNSFGEDRQSKKDAPKETDLRQMATQLFTMKQAIDTAAGTGELAVTKKNELITKVAENAATIREVNYKNSRKNGFWNSLSVTGASAGMGFSWFGLKPVIEAGVSLGWIKGQKIEADQQSLVNVQQRLETMHGAVDLQKDWNETSIRSLNTELGLTESNVLKVGEHSYTNELGKEEKFTTVVIPKSLLDTKTDNLGILIDPRYSGYVKKDDDNFIIPSPLLNIQTVRLANVTSGTRHYLTIGFGGDSEASYMTMMPEDIQNKEDGFKQWEKLRYEVEFAGLNKEFRDYMNTAPTEGKSPKQLLADIQTKSGKTGLDFVKIDGGNNYYFHRDATDKIFVLMEPEIWGEQDNLEPKTKVGDKEYYAIPLEKSIIQVSTDMHDGRFQSLIVTKQEPINLNDSKFVLDVHDINQNNTLDTTRFDLDLDPVSPEVYALMIDHDALMTARYGKKSGGLNSGAKAEYKQFNKLMEGNNLVKAKALVPNLFPGKSLTNLSDADVRGVYGALCLVHKTNLKSFKDGDPNLETSYEKTREKLLGELGKRWKSSNYDFETFKNGLPSKDTVFNEFAPYKQQLENLLQGKYSDNRNHSQDVNSVEYKLYWMLSPLKRVEEARGIQNILSFNPSQKKNTGFDYGSLLWKERGDKAMMDHFGNSFQGILQKNEALQTQLTTVKNSQEAQECLKSLDGCNDVKMYPNSVSAIVGGDNADPNMKYIHHGMFVKGLENDFTTDYTDGALARKERFLEGIKKTEYYQSMVDTLLGIKRDGVNENPTIVSQQFLLVDESGNEITGQALEKILNDMLLYPTTVRVKQSDGNGGWSTEISNLSSEPAWIDGYFVQCFNPSTTLSVQTQLEVTKEYETAQTFTAPSCKSPTPYRNTMAQGVRTVTERVQFGMSAAYQLPEAKAEKPTVTSDPNAEPIKPGEDIDGEVFGNPDTPWEGNTYHERWKDLKNNSPETRSAMNNYIEANKGSASYGAYRNQMIDQWRGLVNSGMNPNKALRQIMGMTIIIDPGSAAGASLNLKYPNPTNRGVQRDIDNANKLAKVKQVTPATSSVKTPATSSNSGDSPLGSVSLQPGSGNQGGDVFQQDVSDNNTGAPIPLETGEVAVETAVSVDSLFAGETPNATNIEQYKHESFYYVGEFKKSYKGVEINQATQGQRMKELYTMIQSQSSALVMFSFEGCKFCEEMQTQVNEYLEKDPKLDKTALIKLDVLDPNNAMILQNLGYTAGQGVPSLTGFESGKAYIPEGSWKQQKVSTTQDANGKTRPLWHKTTQGTYHYAGTTSVTILTSQRFTKTYNQ